MNTENRHTGILVFVRTPAEEAEAKVFTPYGGRRRNRRIARRLNQHAVAAARRTGLPVYVVDSDHQQGRSFGERLVNAIQGVFVHHSTVLVIGNDCPGLTERHLLRAERYLQNRQIVLGPDADGGVYLVGLDREAFQAEEWLRLPWQTGELFRTLLLRAEEAKRGLALLPVEQDADNASSLRRAVRRLPAYLSIRNALLNLLCGSAGVPLPVPVLRSFFRSYSYGLRAPPSWHPHN